MENILFRYCLKKSISPFKSANRAGGTENVFFSVLVVIPRRIIRTLAGSNRKLQLM